MARRAGDRRQQVGRGVGDEVAQRRPVAPEGGDRLLEVGRCSDRVPCGPVVVRPGRLEVGPVPDVLEDVELREPDVLEQVPRRVRPVRDDAVHPVGREVGDGRIERHVRADGVDQLHQLGTNKVEVFAHVRILAPAARSGLGR
jgi:hypothetical protein